jgi:hypothetical protein
MKEATKSVSDLAKPGPTMKTQTDRGDEAMSPTIRELILSFGIADSDSVWNADAYLRRSVT